MKKGMIVSVGTGTRPDIDMALPLLKSVRGEAPGMLFLLVTEGSRPTAVRVRQGLVDAGQLATDEVVLHPLHDSEDLQAVYLDAVAALRALRERGYPEENVVVDFTSGTKPMSAGLALAAVMGGCEYLKYMSGFRREGTVVSGTEQPRMLYPSTILAHDSLRLAYRLLRELRFAAAISLCEGVVPELLDEAAQRERATILGLARAYAAWDLFQYTHFDGSYRGVRNDLDRFPECRVDPTVLPRLIAIQRQSESGILPEDLLVDLLNNTDRRIREGRYDDATARLYRLTEMIAQRALREQDIDTGNVDLERVPPAWRARLEGQRDTQDGKIKIGLRASYEVLESLGHPLGKAFVAARGLHALLEGRNTSLLAHGVKPVNEQDCRGLRADVVALLGLALPDLDERCRALQFPWLRQGSS